MAEEPKRGRENAFEKVKKNLWLILPILLVFVSITSFIAGMNLNTTRQPMGRIVDTIILSPEQKLQSLDVSGRVTYSDGSPYANQLLELHSTPVQTKTDENGYFTFSGVSLGSHTLYLLDEGGEVVSSLNLYVERTPDEKAGHVGMEGNAYRVLAGMDIEALFLQVQLDANQSMKIEKEVLALTFDGTVKNQDGEVAGTAVDFSKGIIEREAPVPSGEGLIEPETVTEGLQAETTGNIETSATKESAQLTPGETGTLPPGESSSAGTTEETPPVETTTKDSGSHDSDDSGSSGTRPTKPSIPEPTPSVPEETTPEPTEEMEHITVSDDKNESWTQNTTIDLFANRTGIGPERKLAPGSEGSYEFQIANGNDFNVYYTITIEKGANQQYLLPLRYRLKAEGEHVSGNTDTWLTAEQLKDSKVDLASKGTCRYLLEWQWPYEGGNDELDTLIGMSDHLEYELVVKIRITQN